MNSITQDNNIAALVDSRDGVAYMKHFTEMFGPALEKVAADNQTHSQKGMELVHGGGEFNQPIDVFTREAFLLLGAFLEPGRIADLKTYHGNNISEERARVAALLTAAITYAMAYTPRCIKEGFKDASEKVTKDMPFLTHNDHSMAYTMLIASEVENLKRDSQLVLNLITTMVGEVHHEVVRNGMMHGYESK